VTVSALSSAGIFAVAPRPELVNLAPLNGSVASTSLQVLQVVQWAGKANADVSTLANCQLVEEDYTVASALTCTSDCVCSTDSSHTRSVSAALVRVTLDLFATNVSLRVWFPRQVWLNVSDTSLGLVLPSTSSGDPELGAGAKVNAVLSAYANASCGIQIITIF